MTATLQISLQTPALTSSQAWADDAKVAATLLAYYNIKQLGDAGLSNQQKLDLVLDDMARNVIETVRGYEYDTRREVARDQIAQDVTDEYDFRQ